MIGLRVLTIGTFDLFHDGHVNLLRRCKRLSVGDYFYIGVNSDAFVKAYKGQPPVCPESVRAATVKAYGSPQLNDGPGGELIRQIKPDLLVVGSDWLEKDYLEQIGMTPEELFEKLGVSLVFVPRTPGVSSSGLRR